MSEHTPAPWTVSEFRDGRPAFVYDTDMSFIANINTGDESGRANARLISAAPDLLEALRAFADPDNAPLIMSDAHSLALIEKARAAIAKATGKGSGA